MNLAERPPGPTVTVCPHGIPEHVPCDRCTDTPPPPTPDHPCPHGTAPDEDCTPCDRADDVGRPRTHAPRSLRLVVARVGGPCPTCHRGIWPGETRVAPIKGRWICEDCARATEEAPR